MTPAARYKAAAVVALIGAAAIEPAAWSGFTTALVLLGAVNVLMPAPATLWTRSLTAIGAFVVLAAPHGLEPAASMLAILLWPPLLLLEWGLVGDGHSASEATPFGTTQSSRVTLAALIVAVAAASAYFRSLSVLGLQQSAALFIGVPALLSIVVIFAARPRSATGVACKAVTVGLLVSLVFLGEGMLCVAMSAPLFYFVAVVAGMSLDKARRAHSPAMFTLRAAAPVLVVIAMSLEGVHHATTVTRDESVTVIKVVRAPSTAVARALFERPRFERTLPLLLQSGFPRPIATERESPSPGARWTIAFRGGEMRIDGLEPRIGDLTLELVESQPGLVRWRAIGDDSHMTHYLAWRESTVRWAALSPAETRVEWTVRYERSLDPAWYFGPMERFAVGLAAGYLIDTVATP